VEERKLVAETGIGSTHIAAVEVTTLQHKSRDDTVEFGTLVAQGLVTKLFVALAEVCEVLGGLGDYLIVKVKVDTTLLSCSEVKQGQQEVIRDPIDEITTAQR
jgi:hypothetical protein